METCLGDISFYFAGRSKKKKFLFGLSTHQHIFAVVTFTNLRAGIPVEHILSARRVYSGNVFKTVREKRNNRTED